MNRNLSKLTLKELENIIENYLIKFESYTKIVNPKANHQEFFLYSTNLRTLIKSPNSKFADCHK